jgi:hypothetical protein
LRESRESERDSKKIASRDKTFKKIKGWQFGEVGSRDLTLFAESSKMEQIRKMDQGIKQIRKMDQGLKEIQKMDQGLKKVYLCVKIKGFYLLCQDQGLFKRIP